MKSAAIIVILLLAGALFMGCATNTSDSSTQSQPEITQDQAMNDIDNSVIANDAGVDIGEPIY